MALAPFQLVLYRVVRTNPAHRSDFWSDLSNGLVPRPAQRVDIHAWAGISMYTESTAAEVSARTFHLGRYIARLRITEKVPALVKQTLKDGHYSIAGDPAALLACVEQILPLS
jgi:hypothetical protein